MTNIPTHPPAPAAVSLPSAERFAILRRKQVQAQTGFARSTIYNRIAAGLFTKPVSLGGRAVGWPATEIVVLNAARIAGWSDDKIRSLVGNLEAARASFGEMK